MKPKHHLESDSAGISSKKRCGTCIERKISCDRVHYAQPPIPAVMVFLRVDRAGDGSPVLLPTLPFRKDGNLQRAAAGPRTPKNRAVRWLVIYFSPAASTAGLSALYRHGHGLRAEEMKLSALRALSKSVSQATDVKIAVQHVAASMVLSVFETQQTAETTNQWLFYLRGATSIVRSHSTAAFCSITDGGSILEWVYYHGLLARFSLRHWREPRQEAKDDAAEYTKPTHNPWTTVNDTLLDTSAHCMKEGLRHNIMFEPLNVLSSVVAELVPRHDRAARTTQYRTRVRELGHQVRTLGDQMTGDAVAKVRRAKAEAYRISTIIYMSRVTGESVVPESDIPLLVERGLRMTSLISSCERPLPLLILGSEARTDEARVRVLDLLGAANDRGRDRDLRSVRWLLHALWTQDDLASDDDREVDYIDKLSYVFSSSVLVPHFACRSALL
ncbi:hypothetical protein HYQ45_005418 [Verticillium longisporum]|uniref:Zn(2)-C6 fungal-type domain-containing protein n=1 Tax=Verticillium longisporum TaxID=100787 RepID=A0A8I2ZR09_VERLO|nr:hypothetical protein HYQ45_005418 [Verticillium longisporum]